MVEGEALVTRDAIFGWGGIDSRTGTIVEARHELRGVSFAGWGLVLPGTKGSSVRSNAFLTSRARWACLESLSLKATLPG